LTEADDWLRIRASGETRMQSADVAAGAVDRSAAIRVTRVEP
jgi:hypothetical protein